MIDGNDSDEPLTRVRSQRHIWIIGIVVSVFLGIVVAWMGSSGSSEAFGLPVFGAVIGYAFLLNWVVFVPSYLARTEKYFDLTGSLTYISATIAALAFSSHLDLRAWIASGLVMIWAARLGTFLFRRIQITGHDGRFDVMKHDFWQFLMTWTIQGLWVSLTSAAALVMITTVNRSGLGVVGFIGISLWAIGFLFEIVADRQKTIFKSNPENEGRFIKSGLWAWCRHPNYFGEILLWSGVAVMAIPVLSGWTWFALVSPVFVFVLLTRISGIPLLQQRANQRWGHEPEYQDYIKNTSLLIPMPPKSGR